MSRQQRIQPNDRQRDVIEDTESALLVLAPVGTGKTYVLAERIKRATAEGVEPNKVLCLTFTNRAANQMRDRLREHSAEVAKNVVVKTFHGLCAYMLRQEAKHIDLYRDFVIYDEVDCLSIVNRFFDPRSTKAAKDAWRKICDMKTVATGPYLSLRQPWQSLFDTHGTHFAEAAISYQRRLRRWNALDFADLVYLTRAMLAERPGIRERWQAKFHFIQVDEVQDTNIAEYEIIRHLACQSGNIAVFGDVDQTIYEWRGSRPDEVLARYRSDFQPSEYELVENYRAPRKLLLAADSFANSFQRRATRITPSRYCQSGTPIIVHHADTDHDEGRWIARKMHELANGRHATDYKDMAVLTRSNYRSTVISKQLKQQDIPHVTVETYQFFKRQEVKDALAYLKLLLNPYDTIAMLRAVRRPPRGIGDATISRIGKAGISCGLRLPDLAMRHTVQSGDPFGPLLREYTEGRIVVFDVETTGLRVGRDEVIQIVAQKLIRGKPTDEPFVRFIRNTVPVGDSERIHGFSDAHLRKNGEQADVVLADFLDFVDDALLVGHNIGFDIKMITAHLRRVGLQAPRFEYGDTLELARRFLVDADRYSLEALAEHLALEETPTHDARRDVATTVELLQKLIPYVRETSLQRIAIVNEYGASFTELGELFDIWRDDATTLRPPELLSTILDESGLRDHYSEEQYRLDNLNKLERVFRNRDDCSIHPETALRSTLEFTALAKNIDMLSEEENQAVVVTIHQAKGLEFDAVFVAGATSGEIPHRRSVNNGNAEEERRLFYVALTRASERLFVSGHRADRRYSDKAMSPFIGEIDSKYVQYE